MDDLDIRANMSIVDKNSLIAIGNVVVGERIVIQPVKVIAFEEDGKQEARVCLPRKKNRNGGWDSVISITDPEMMEKIKKTVLQAVTDELSKDLAMPIEVTSLNLYRKEGSDIRGYATIRYAGCIEIKGLQIRRVKSPENEGKPLEDEAMQLIFPYTLERGDIVNLVNTTGRWVKFSIEQVVLTEYYKKVTEQQKVHGRENREGVK